MQEVFYSINIRSLSSMITSAVLGEPIVNKLVGPEGTSTDTRAIEKLWEPSSAMSSTMVKGCAIVLPLVDPAGNVSVEFGKT